MRSITTHFTDPRLRVAVLVLYYLAIQVGLFVIASRQGFTPPPFIYQGF